MPAPPPPPLHLSSQFGPYGKFVLPPADVAPLLDPGERVGGLPPRRRRRVLRAMLGLSLAGAAAWQVAERREDALALLSQATAMLDGLQPMRQTPPPPREDQAKLADPLPVAERDLASLPVVGEPDQRPDATQTRDPERLSVDAQPEKSAPPERLPVVVADPADALQQKALAAGLHPGLSRALLEELTPEDFRNAAIAVGRVLKEEKAATPIVWPRQRAPGRAQFKIKLVEGAPPECRRYVVQIARGGWETTARPMERCRSNQAFKPS